AELVRCTLRARHPRTSSRAGRWPRADRVGTRRTVARRPRPSRGRQATASRTRTLAPTSYGARYEFGTGVRVGVADADAGALRASAGGTAPGRLLTRRPGGRPRRAGAAGGCGGRVRQAGAAGGGRSPPGCTASPQPAGPPSVRQLVHPNPPRTVHATSSAPEYEFAHSSAGAGGGWHALAIAGRPSSSPPTRTSEPSSYRARYEFGTGVRVRGRNGAVGCTPRPRRPRPATGDPGPAASSAAVPQPVDEQPGHAVDVALVEHGRGHADLGDGVEELVGADVLADLAGLGGGVEQRAQRGHEPAPEVGRQVLVRRVAGVQRAGEAALGGEEALEPLEPAHQRLDRLVLLGEPGGRIGARVDLVAVHRGDQVRALRVVAVQRAGADTRLLRDVADRGVDAALGEHLRGSGEQRVDVALGVGAHTAVRGAVDGGRRARLCGRCGRVHDHPLRKRNSVPYSSRRNVVPVPTIAPQAQRSLG